MTKTMEWVAAAILVLVVALGANAGSRPKPRPDAAGGPPTSRPDSEVGAEDGRSLKVVTFNILKGRWGLERIADYLRRQDADVIFLQEVNCRSEQSGEGQAEVLAREIGGYHWISGDSFDLDAAQQCDVAILARRPLEDVAKHETPAGGRVFAVSALISGFARPLRVVSVHATSTSQMDSKALVKSTEKRFSELAALIEYAGGYQGDILVAGDFNAAPWMPEYLGVSRVLTDLAPSAFRDKATYPSYRPAVRIDYLFARGAVSAKSFAVGRERLSDHLPIAAELQFDADTPTSRPAKMGEDPTKNKNDTGGGRDAANRKDGTSRRPDRRCDDLPSTSAAP